MLDKTHTGNRVDEPDFLKVLLTLKRNVMKDTNVAEVCKVTEVKENSITAIAINNSSLRLNCIKLKNLEIAKNDLVVVLFTNTDFRLNLSKIRQNQNIQNITEDILHSTNYGIIIGVI